jgi:serine/threonine-protein kinase
MNTIPRKLGRYVVIREIGRGAMGVVYKAHDPVIEREVAIKAIQIAFDVPPDEKDVYLSRFYREAKAAGQLSHPNIVTIFDVDEDPETGTPFIVMEFLEGTTISEVAASGVLLPLEDINHMMIQLADALNYAHSEGIVHRDIKAANILILPGMKVKIMDFGIARLPSSDLTQSGQFIGTPNYMSPEQIEGKTQLDGRSDLFSLGVIFYMLLTNERPFPGDSFNTVSYRIVHVDHAPPRTLNPNLPEIYNAILMKLLAKDPADRYQTGAEVVADLKKIMANLSAIEDLREIDLDSTASGKNLPPPPPDPFRQKRNQAIPAPPEDKLPSVSRNKRILSLGLMILFILALTAGAIVLIGFMGGQKQETATIAPGGTKQPDPIAELSRQNAIRIKWDLAMKYLEGGTHDKAIQELNDILRLDPQNEDARKFLELVEEKKATEEQKQLEPPLPQPRELVKKPKPVPVVSEIPQLDPANLQPAPEIKTAVVHFEFEHNFPSGSFYIFTNEKLVFEGRLASEKKKVLMFTSYEGKLVGSLDLPVGQTKLLVHVVCREKEISASKHMTVNVTEGTRHSLKIKYSKSPEQLELSWI